MGIRELLNEWINFRINCISRRTAFDLKKKEEKLHLLKGLKMILLDIDKAVKIVRETEEESEVVPNLMIGFGIDEIQAEYVAEIKLRHLNKEYILKRISEIESLEEEIADLKAILASKQRIKTIIVKELKNVAEKYGKPRRSILLYNVNELEEAVVEEIPDYPVNLFFSKEGYFKKITPQSLRMSGEQKLKEGDEILQHFESTNSVELLFFTNKCQVYKTRASEFSDTKASVLGDYVSAKLQMDEGEVPVKMIVTKDYSGMLIFGYENGKVSKVPLNAYYTKTNRKKLLNAYSDKSPLTDIIFLEEDKELMLTSSGGRILLLHTGSVNAKTSKTTQGIAIMRMKKGQYLESIKEYPEDMFKKPSRYRTKTLPALGAFLTEEDSGNEQLSIL
jgi:DNA gyrase subunit A